MGVYVKDGTPLHGKSLCEGCVNAHIERGYRESETLIFCQATNPEHRVRFPVRECSVIPRSKGKHSGRCKRSRGSWMSAAVAKLDSCPQPSWRNGRMKSKLFWIKESSLPGWS